MKTHDLNTPAREILGDAFFDGLMPHPCVRVMELARETVEEEVARDRAALKRIGAGAATAGGLAGYVVAKGRANAAGPVLPAAAPVVTRKGSGYWGKKKAVRRVKVKLGRLGIEDDGLKIVDRGLKIEDWGLRIFDLEEKRDALSKARDVSIIAGTGAAGVGSLVAAQQVRKVGKKAVDAMGHASSAVARTAKRVRENVTPQSVAHEGAQIVKRKVKQTVGEYFPTFAKVGRGISRVLKKNLADRTDRTDLSDTGFATPARAMGIEFATATVDRSKVRDDGGKWADHWKVASGMQKGYHADGSEAKVGMADPAVLKGLYRKANVVNKWGTRGGSLVKDAADVVAGKPRQRDASGRKKKREWEKGWAKDTVKKALIVGGGIGYGIAYKKSPRLRATHDKVLTSAKKAGNEIKDAISNFETPARRLGIEFVAKKEDSSAAKVGVAGAAIGGANGAVFGGVSAAHSKQADDYFGLVKRRERSPSGGGVAVLRKGEVKPFRKKGKFGAGERLARAEHESLQRLKKTVTSRSLKGGLAGAAALGGLSYAAAGAGGRRSEDGGRKKRFETPASRLGLIELDEVAADAGWDVRDPRGRSARVFAPGARRRIRREKTWSEEVGNERRLWKAGVVGAGVLAGAAGIAVGKRMPKAVAKEAAEKVVVPFPKRRRG